MAMLYKAMTISYRLSLVGQIMFLSAAVWPQF